MISAAGALGERCVTAAGTMATGTTACRTTGLVGSQPVTPLHRRVAQSIGVSDGLAAWTTSTTHRPASARTRARTTVFAITDRVISLPRYAVRLATANQRPDGFT